MTIETMNQPLTLYAPAKLNLTLDVLFRRPDGYHELDMLNIRIDLCDELEFTLAKDTIVTYDGMPAPENDIVQKSIRLYAQRAGVEINARVHVRKRIPSEAGLGGGSADGAAVLMALENTYGALGQSILEEVALQVGADVPYCLYDVPCRARGVGERIDPVPMPNTALWFVLLKPTAGISTAALFSALSFPVCHPRTEEAILALSCADAEALGPLLMNALQGPAQTLLPEIASLTARLKTAGALGACMTGSGSAVFGLFAAEEEAVKAAGCFADIPFVRVCRSLSGNTPMTGK